MLGDIQSVEVPIASIVSNTLHSEDINFILQQHNIGIRTGHLCAQPLLSALGLTHTARISAAYYNTVEEIKRVGKALRGIAQ